MNMKRMGVIMSAIAYQCISGDSHLEVDAKRWRHRVPEKYRERAPRLIKTATGGDAWVIEGQAAREVPSDLYGGKGRENWQPFGQTYEGTAGTGPAEQRVAEQDRDGLDAEVLYPAQVGGPWLWRNIPDDDAYKAIVRAYNDWLAEEYCAVAPDRLIGLGILPMTNVNDAIAELQHCARLGYKGVLLSAFPDNKGYPSREDDRFWAAALDMAMPVTIHIELNRLGERAGPLLRYPSEDRETLKKIGSIGLAEQVSRFHRVGGLNAVQMVLDGLFDRFPNLKIYMAETHAGWLPFFLHMADVRYQRHYGWAQSFLGFQPLKRLPSEYIREHIYWGFLDDPIGVEMRHHIGVDRLIWATDFPHQESDWPDSGEVIKRVFDGVPEDETYRMVAGNVVEFFHLHRR
jgi:predicted TIM-barrel fold metal-dependent hydrolase